jgi:hypothetical protein
MNIRPFHPLRDYATVKKWWQAHNWTPVHVSRLPKIGRMVCDESGPIVAAWLYKLEGVAAGWMEYTIANPDSTPELRKEAINRLIRHFDEEAKLNNIDCLMSFTNHPSLIQHFKDGGYQVADQNITMLMRKLV